MDYLSNNALTYFNQANKLLNQGQYRDAIRYYDRAIEVAPGFSSAYQQKRLAEKAQRRANKLHHKSNKSLQALIPTLSIFCAVVAMSFIFYQI